ncbi:unnamed protein product [Cylicocyclus nassatus]|uniref:Peptidase A2 domain-containing protein n=1 Tax=Cylicocyclus nassatus TaxID=53992 RepID=A0AA36GLD7_CYLNA|nr:unnamed protein product [Cylicocyclus nassatus]
MGSPRPPKRSRAQSVSRAEAPSSAEECEFARRVKQTFSQVADDAFVIGREVKTLRDATASAITDAWKDAKAATVTLARQVNDSNQSLITNLNNSFNAVGQRIDQLPGTPRPSEGSRLPEIPYFTGANKDPTPFSQAVEKAQIVEELSPVTDHPIHSLSASRNIPVNTITPREGYRHDRFKTIDALVFLVEHNAILAEDSATWHNNAHPKFDVPREGATLHWYIDPSTFVISHEASPTECSSLSPFYFADRDKYVRFDAALGQFTTLPHVETLASPPHLNSSSLALPLTIFYNLVLTNLTELTQDHQLRELWSTVDQERLLRVDQSSSPFGNTHSEHTPSFSLFSLIFGSWSLFDIWITSCSILVTFQVVKTAFILYIDLNYPGALSQFRRRFSRNPAGFTAPDITVTNVVRPPPTSIEPVELIPLTIDATSAWPPRASFNPVNVLAIRGDDSFFVAQIPIKVNNVNILALIDTGAVITVTSSSTASLLGIFALFESDIPAALGMAGIPINLIGIAHLRFQIGSFTFNHPVYFTETPCVPESGGSYNIILGNDLLSRLPSWCISYNRRLFTVAGEQINILCSAPTPAPLVDSTVPVRVAETTVLPPQTETFVPCFSYSNASSLVLTSQPATVTDKYLMVSPAIIRSGKSHVLVANPCASS